MAIRQKARLGDVLVQAGAITQGQLDQALLLHRQKGIQIGQALLELKFVTEEKLTASLSKQIGVPYVDLTEIRLDSNAVKKVQEKVARMHKLIPIKIKDGKLQVAMANPLDLLAVDEAIIQAGMDVELFIATERDVDHAIQEYYGVAASIQAAVKSIGAEDRKKDQVRASVQSRGSNALDASDAPVARLVEMILKQALDDNASDIHIEPTETEVSIRYRIDGVLFQATSSPKSVESALISRVKVLANLDIAESRSPQDGAFSAKFEEREIEFRVSTCPTVYGENMVLRILDRSKIMLSLEDLGLVGPYLKKLEGLLRKPYGVILVTGPTGSGKTTTLYAAMSLLNTPEKNIKTIEDPVEYRLPGVRQTQVNPKANITFANGLRSLMRQDPDIIMVGEIRDSETGEIAVQAALTGHLVFSTLHTNDAAGAITRLDDLGIEPFLLASSIVGILAQRLVRKICPHCKTQHEPSEAELNTLFPRGNAPTFSLYKGEGCKSCKKSGYSGRMGIFEILEITDPIRELILKKSPPMVLRDAARKTQKMKVLRQDGFSKVLSGQTTLAEIDRVTTA